MKQLTLLLIIFAHVSVIAQPTLTSNEMAPFGSSWTLTYTQNFSVMDTNIQGANATWNFTAVQPTPTTLTINIVDPAQTPYGPSFPNANYAYVESPNTAYRYFNLTPAKMERVGSWSSIGLKIYNDPQIEYVYPLTMGSYSYDTWDNSSRLQAAFMNCKALVMVH